MPGDKSHASFTTLCWQCQSVTQLQVLLGSPGDPDSRQQPTRTAQKRETQSPVSTNLKSSITSKKVMNITCLQPQTSTCTTVVQAMQVVFCCDMFCNACMPASSCVNTTSHGGKGWAFLVLAKTYHLVNLASVRGALTARWD